LFGCDHCRDQPILLHGSETRALTRALEDRIAAFDNICLRRILRIPYTDRVTNAEYDSKPALHRSCCPSSKQDGSVSSGMWQGWATHMTSSEPSILQSAGAPRTKDWRRRPGRPRHTWLRTTEADLQPLNHGLNSAWRHAQDREYRKMFILIIHANE